MRPAFHILISILLLSTYLDSYAQSSVLSQGAWKKLAAPTKGVYVLGRSDLQSMGINPNEIDPIEIQIYGGMGGMLPQSNSIERPLGLSELSIHVTGEEDGSFDEGDLVLFYSPGPDQLLFNSSSGVITYQKNLYADSAYYFLTTGQRAGKRIATRPSETPSGDQISVFPELVTHEIDQTNILSSGRYWVGESFSAGANATQRIELETPGRLPGNIRLLSQVMGRSPAGGQFSVGIDGGGDLGSHVIASYPDVTYGNKGQFDLQLFEANMSSVGEQTQLSYTYSGSASANLDYLVFQYPRALTLGDEPVFFRGQSDFNGPRTFEVANTTASTLIWNVSSTIDPYALEYSNQSGNAQITEQVSEYHEYVAFEPANASSPIYIGEVANQDLLGMSTPDAIFVTHPTFLPQAERLASFRRNNDGLNVLVVTTPQIYNEFSAGAQDITAIRDFVRHLYQKSPSTLKYLLLFGDGSYDFKDRTIVDHNFVPVYQSRNSTHRIYSYSSDDYYGFLEDDEGEWAEDNNGLGGDHTLDIGVGRLPAKSLQEAEQLVTKLIRYQTSNNRLGDWRSKIYFLADDGDFNIHLKDAEGLAGFVDTTYSYFDLNKVYVDAYEQIRTGGNETVPEATRMVENIFDEGALIVNFTGHGNEGQWTEEELLIESMIPNFRNRVKLPLLVTATCEFGAYDNPLRLSGGEQMILNPEGGAIALLTTTRPVFAHTNRPVNEAFYKNAFKPINGEQPRLGDIIKATKNNSLRGSVNRNFALLGDPTMRLAYTDYTVSLDLQNDQSDTLRALGTYQFAGQVGSLDGTVNSSFNGKVTINIFDKALKERTLGDESQPTEYEVRTSALFRGEATVTNGRFNFDFVVPKNISYKHGRGKISMYAQSNDGLVDANGAITEFIVGGSAPQASSDDTPPEVEVFINSEDFTNGGKVGQNPLLLMNLADENGISLSRTGIGQQMIAVLDNDQAIELSDFYIADLDTYKSGTVRYPLGNLAEGFHSLTTKVWDNHNNATTNTVEFYVGSNSSINITDLKNYPNPMQDFTTFGFGYDRAGEGVEVTLSIISIGGELVFEQRYTLDEADSVIDQISWDGRYTNGSLVANGIYIYKLFVRSTTDGSKSEAYEKLIIAN